MGVANLRAIREVARNFTSVNYSVGGLKRRTAKHGKTAKSGKTGKPAKSGKTGKTAKSGKTGKTGKPAKSGKTGKTAKTGKPAKPTKPGKLGGISKGLYRHNHPVGCNCVLRSAIRRHIGIFARLRP